MLIIDNRQFELSESYIWRHNMPDFIFTLDLESSPENDYMFFKRWHETKLLKDIRIINKSILETFYGCNISIVYKIAEIKYTCHATHYIMGIQPSWFCKEEEKLISFEEYKKCHI